MAVQRLVSRLADMLGTFDMADLAQNCRIPNNAHGHLIATPPQREIARQEDQCQAQDANGDQQPWVQFQDQLIRHPDGHKPHCPDA